MSSDTLLAAKFDHLPKELRDLLSNRGYTAEMVNANFSVVLRILNYITGKNFIETDTSEQQLLKKADPTKVYKKLESGGKGGFGQVFHAKHLENKLLVAIKRVKHTKKEKVPNFTEILLLRSFDHQNIVRYIETYEWNEELWIVMEFMEGGTLREAINIRKFLECEISYVVRQILRALHHLSLRNIVHKDLKSSNIMLSVDGDVKLIDFGLSVDKSTTSKSKMAGTAYWMAPEIARRDAYSCSADIWSLGIILLEMANKEKIPKSGLKAMYSCSVGKLDPGFLLEDEPGWSNDFKTFLAQCLQVDPTKRPTPKTLYSMDFIKNGPEQYVFANSVQQVFIAKTMSFDFVS